VCLARSVGYNWAAIREIQSGGDHPSTGSTPAPKKSVSVKSVILSNMSGVIASRLGAGCAAPCRLLVP
jgi:hypothetical protein